MNININDKDYELNFGIGFLREIDKVAGLDVNGVSMGMGMSKTLPAIQSYDMLALINVIYSATHACNPRPGIQDIEEYIGTLKDKDVEKLFTDVVKELKKSPVTRFQMNKMAQ
ncbi:tail assembly chaperone [Lactobacillus terrae]|uniref:tail assembly chaperone n=1 Tax=Lactobacillus terrae TaxID=2269374 RepID=UPI000C1B7BA7|nr:tail assembly chaperone [Lactobacillus terrae]